ncbi:hypothetical protein EST38_g10164 [Candolleomyces aberdarensis]|uniref:Uncharacterized protein n=1 Tax=Candolleomyces aberdarensis TaxID=2316362 RepID=A0A4Q2DAW7_9AGAR|nr:hypothetical protein EST38_g10164 [Candolleomyces aberdarensis]
MFQIFDLTRGNEHARCEVLTNPTNQGRLRPRLHDFGHIHDAYGVFIKKWGVVGTDETLKVQNTLNYPMEGDLGSPVGAKSNVHESQVEEQRGIMSF